MRTKAFGEKTPAGAVPVVRPGADCPHAGTCTPTTSAPPALRKARRETLRMRMRLKVMASRERLRRFLDRRADPHVRRAAAEVARHRLVDVGVGRPLVLREQCGGRHHLPRLAVAALRDVELLPRRLYGLRLSRLQTLDRR